METKTTYFVDKQAEARQEHQEQLAEAERRWAELAREADQSQTRANFAIGAVRDFDREHGARKHLAHEGVDLAVEAAQARLAVALKSMTGPLCRPDAADVAGLASLWVATRPEFAADLHGLLDGAAGEGLSDLDDAQFRGQRAKLLKTAEGIRNEAQAARETAKAAAAARTELELGRA